MSATINAFPPLHSFTFRHWSLLLIAALHLALFWLINSGMSQDIIRKFIPPDMTVIMPFKEVKPEPQAPKLDPHLDFTRIVIPTPSPPPVVEFDEPPVLQGTVMPPVPLDPGPARETVREPVIAEPQIDPRVGLSEPLYPATEIRLGHEGTVLLSVYVLENGRVGDVRIDQSSGYERLDAAATREARRWRLKPGLRDGVPVAMWKQIPITYQLKNIDGSRTLRY